MWLTDDLHERMRDYMGGIIRKMKGHLLAGGGVEDHIHLLALLRPSISISDVLRTIKCNSTNWVHQTLPNLKTFCWQDEYAGFTVSKSGIPRVMSYIQNQQRRHKRMTFKEELITLLDKHEIEYDPRYILR